MAMPPTLVLPVSVLNQAALQRSCVSVLPCDPKIEKIIQRMLAFVVLEKLTERSIVFCRYSETMEYCNHSDTDHAMYFSWNKHNV